MKFNQLINQYVFLEDGFKVGEIKDLIVDTEEWKVTHLEVELTIAASEQILGVRGGMFEHPRHTLAISALEKGVACCTEQGIELKVSKGQLANYLRPA